jgi:aminopeptidase N
MAVDEIPSILGFHLNQRRFLIMKRPIIPSLKKWLTTVTILMISVLFIAAGLQSETESERTFVIQDQSADTDGKTDIKNHTIRIELFPKKHKFRAMDEMFIRSQGEFIILNLNKDFQINSASLNGKKIEFHFDRAAYDTEPKRLDDDNVASDFKRAGRVKIPIEGKRENTLFIEYEGSIFEEPSASQFSRQYIANQTSGIISEQGAFLSPESFWYPRGDEEMSRFEIQTTTPARYETVTQGTRLKHETKEDKLFVVWKNEQLSDAIYLQAGPYEIQEDEIDSVKIYTYFFPGGAELASLYLNKSKQYIAMYNELLGEYPYDKFAVVENFFETGYGMPSWTLLGRTVVRLPFIPDTSLPHEICHNWWGNGVFIDYSQGNWCEGLTVYCADYLLKKKTVPGGDVDYRRQTNRDYASYVKKLNDFPLSEFRSRYNPASRSVGYGKTMMVFHQLQRRIGEETFFKSLRRLMKDFRFKKASWEDVLWIFEEESGIILDNFYELWVGRAGAPVLRLENVNLEREGEGFTVSFDIVQVGDLYELDVPVLIKAEEGEFKKYFNVNSSRERFRVSLDKKPIYIEIDPEHHLFRRLYPEEIPPSIAKVFGSEKQLIVLPAGVDEEKQKTYRAAAEMINRTKTGVIKLASEVKREELADFSLILLGEATEAHVFEDYLSSVSRVAPWEEDQAEQDNAGRTVVYNHPSNEEYGIMVITGNSKSDILSIVRKLPHYGKYSYLLFHGDTNVARGVWEIESSPLIYVFK